MKKTLLSIISLSFFNLAHAGGTEDKIADVASWIVLIILPVVGVYLFWEAHIYPEKVAERNHHPQLSAIKTLCLLSLIFGGLLWPFALVWANYKYSDVEYPDKDKKTLDTPTSKTDEPSSTQNEE